MSIIFLDIDGVLLTRRAWAMPCNDAARDLASSDFKSSVKAVSYDPVGVGLVNRLCRIAGAKLVISSNWRYTVGPEETRQKLVGQGIDAAHFHPAYACPRRFRADAKWRDIRDWLDEHRATPLPEWPETPGTHATDEERAACDAAYWQVREARDEPGFRYVTIDDEEVQAPHLIRTTFSDGITGSVYRIACRALGGVDELMGVREIEDADMARLSDAFRGDYLWVATFLESGETTWRARQLRGNPDAFWAAVADEVRYVEPEDVDPEDVSDEF
jgi:hypothetical protein